MLKMATNGTSTLYGSMGACVCFWVFMGVYYCLLQNQQKLGGANGEKVPKFNKDNVKQKLYF